MEDALKELIAAGRQAGPFAVLLLLVVAWYINAERNKERDERIKLQEKMFELTAKLISLQENTANSLRDIKDFMKDLLARDQNERRQQ